MRGCLRRSLCGEACSVHPRGRGDERLRVARVCEQQPNSGVCVPATITDRSSPRTRGSSLCQIARPPFWAKTGSPRPRGRTEAGRTRGRTVEGGSWREIFGEVAPGWVQLLDQLELPGSVP